MRRLLVLVTIAALALAGACGGKKAAATSPKQPAGDKAGDKTGDKDEAEVGVPGGGGAVDTDGAAPPPPPSDPCEGGEHH